MNAPKVLPRGGPGLLHAREVAGHHVEDCFRVSKHFPISPSWKVQKRPLRGLPVPSDHHLRVHVLSFENGLLIEAIFANPAVGEISSSLWSRSYF